MADSTIGIVGGGIVGVATAYRLLARWPDRRVLVFEKEAELAAHQTGRNSGVIHSGIYYRPGSLKAINCRRGKALLEDFCEREGIPFDRCGKVIVATGPDQLPALEEILRRGRENGVDCRRIGPSELAELEPHARGIAAIHVPESGIVDYRVVTERLAALVREGGGEVLCRTGVEAILQGDSGVVVETTRGEYHVDALVTCGGLQSDRLTAMSGRTPSGQIVPFRGEYFRLAQSAEHLCRGLIYPVPDPRFPFLGVHFTRMIAGGVECGPNAVLAFAREGYDWLTLDVGDLVETLRYRGFRRLAARYWRPGVHEMWRSLSRGAFVRALQELVPEVRRSDLEPIPAGVRAQCLGPEGELVDDFLIQAHGRIVNVENAPSPAATASLSIADQIVRALEAA